jgi:hypothetical protein
LTSFWAQVDFNKIPVRNLVIEGSPVPPLNPIAGMFWVDDTDPDDALLMWYDGDEWIDLGSAQAVGGEPGPQGPAGPAGPSGTVVFGAEPVDPVVGTIWVP